MVKTFLTLCRVSNLPTVWMNVLTAALLVGQANNLPLEPGTLVLLMLSLSLFYMGGMSFNDYMDRHWDAQHQTFRPIPSGKISATTALIISLVLFSAAQVLLLFAPQISGFYMGFLLLAVIVAYDAIHKATPLSVIVMASARLLVFAVTAYALTQEWVTVIWIAGGLQFIYTLLVTVVARYEHRRQQNYSIPLIPLMIAGMAILDGLVLAVLVNPWWIFIGLVAAAMTRFGQKYVRGD
ncbi:UbiA family prenyltransferase [Cellvibrio sp. ARAG 10.3]|uniref:UbiA family prenyltransferase n=1 Tax=Cellvibrio sp. ARAG 10.3 TaxID=3451358 RepID=UPI003F466145